MLIYFSENYKIPSKHRISFFMPLKLACSIQSVKGAVANQHNFLITTVITLFFIYLRTELNYLSNDIILCGFVVVVYTL